MLTVRGHDTCRRCQADPVVADQIRRTAETLRNGPSKRKSSVACVLRQGPVRLEGCKTCGGKNTQIKVYYCGSKDHEVKIDPDCIDCPTRREE
ncbi:hypothetical protein HQ535_14150 [bacterium]|nr:hypothetical protein [bacterium]